MLTCTIPCTPPLRMWAGLVKTLVEKLEGRPDAASYIVESLTSGETYECRRLECGCEDKYE